MHIMWKDKYYCQWQQGFFCQKHKLSVMSTFVIMKLKVINLHSEIWNTKYKDVFKYTNTSISI